MKRILLPIFVVVALAQLSVPAMMAWNRSQTLKHGRVWKFKTAPVDPVDAVRGRYVALQFEAEEVPQNDRINWNEDVYVRLKEDADGFAVVDRLSNEPIADDSAFRAISRGWWEGKQRLTFPFQKYWVAEQVAPEAENAYRLNSTRTHQNAFVTVRVRNGDAALEQLYIDNKPLVEYLRAVQSAH
jgi:uncharacterized membrane-anchored protein